MQVNVMWSIIVQTGEAFFFCLN